MLLLRLALFVFTALHSAIAFPLSEQKESGGFVAQSGDNRDAVRVIEDGNLIGFCGQMLEAGESPVATVTTTVPPSITTSAQTISPVAIAMISSGIDVQTITVSQPAAEVTNTITVSSVPSESTHSIPRDILDQIRSQVRPDIWSDFSRNMASQSTVAAPQTAGLLYAGQEDSKRKKVAGNDNNRIQCNQAETSRSDGGTSIVASINYSANNGYAINGVKVPPRLYPYQALTIAAACRQVLNKGISSSVPGTTSETAAVVAPRVMGSRTLTVTVTNETAAALSTTYKTTTMAGVAALSSTTYTVPQSTTTTTTTSTNSAETRTVNVYVLVSTITGYRAGSTTVGGIGKGGTTASPTPSVTTTTPASMPAAAETGEFLWK